MTEEEKKIRHKKQQKEWREKNHSRVLELKNRWYKKNAEKLREESRQYRKNNPEKVKKTQKDCNSKPKRIKKQKKYIENWKNSRTPESIKKNKDRRMVWERNKIKNDNLYKLTRMARAVIRCAFRNKGKKKSSKSQKILGCTFKQFKLHIEKQFESWMNWDNHGVYTGRYNETWQIDHIIPMETAKTVEDIIRLNHYTNLRPLCSKKNSEKHSKLI